MSMQRMAIPPLVLAIIVSAVCAQPEPLLPKGARARLGSIGISVGAQGTPTAISPDGKYVVADIGRGPILFDRATGKPLTKLTPTEPHVQALAFALVV